MLHSEGPVPQYAGPGFSSRRLDLDGVPLPLADHLIVIAPDGMFVALDAAGRLNDRSEVKQRQRMWRLWCGSPLA